MIIVLIVFLIIFYAFGAGVTLRLTQKWKIGYEQKAERTYDYSSGKTITAFHYQRKGAGWLVAFWPFTIAFICFFRLFGINKAEEG